MDSIPVQATHVWLDKQDPDVPKGYYNFSKNPSRYFNITINEWTDTRFKESWYKDLIEKGEIISVHKYRQGFGHVPEPVEADTDPGEDPTNAAVILSSGAKHLADRASERDTGSERSMEACVKSFNAMFGTHLSTEQGWAFMVLLKMSRSKGGDFRLDDYEDMAAYAALMGEESARERT